MQKKMSKSKVVVYVVIGVMSLAASALFDYAFFIKWNYWNKKYDKEKPRVIRS